MIIRLSVLVFISICMPMRSFFVNLSVCLYDYVTLFMSLYTYLSVYVSNCQFAYLFMFPPICMSVGLCLWVYLTIRLSIYQCARLCIRLTFYASICPIYICLFKFICLSMFLSLSLRMSVYASVSTRNYICNFDEYLYKSANKF